MIISLKLNNFYRNTSIFIVSYYPLTFMKLWFNLICRLLLLNKMPFITFFNRNMSHIILKNILTIFYLFNGHNSTTLTKKLYFISNLKVWLNLICMLTLLFKPINHLFLIFLFENL